jgi:hypothetical protein
MENGFDRHVRTYYLWEEKVGCPPALTRVPTTLCQIPVRIT